MSGTTDVDPRDDAASDVALREGNIRLERPAPGVATVVLDRPDALNAQTPATWRALAAVGRALAGDVRVVVVRAEGRAFSAGLDKALFGGGPQSTEPGLGAGGTAEPGLGALGTLPADELDRTIDGFQDAFRWLRRSDLVSIAAVQGPAVGAGFQLALACDLRIAAEDARFRMAETSLGLVPDLGGTKPLVDLVGLARATEICLTGRWVGAQEAHGLGLANRVVPLEGLAAATEELVAALLTPPRDAVVETKALLAGAGGRTQSEQEAAERAAQARRLRDLAGLTE